MKEVQVNWVASEPHGSDSFTLEELNISNIEEWNGLNYEEQEEVLQTALDQLPMRTFIIVDTFD